jgi:hypothetical protein
MGKIDFSELRPTAPLEAIIGVSAILRGIYLYIAEQLGKNTVVTTDSGLYNIVVGTIFFASGCMLVYGSLKPYRPFRFVGLTLVGLQTTFVIIKTLASGVIAPFIIGNVTLTIATLWLLVLLFREDE